jgi:hypothetical protein
MDLVEIPLGSHRYRFRRLPWQEQARLVFQPGDDQTLVLLCHALADVSGLKIASPEDARKVLVNIPAALRRKFWIVYQGKLPDDRYFTTRGLYEAPEPKQYTKAMETEEQRAESGNSADLSAIPSAHEEVKRRFGPGEAAEARELERRMVAQARRDGVLVKAKED